MKIIGVAPMIAIPTFIYLILTILVTYLSDGIFNITSQSNYVILAAGKVLIVTGALDVVWKIIKTFDKGTLMTDGLYNIFRNTTYATYLIFVVPGISLLFNSLLALTTIILNYILFSFLIKREHQYLREKFGMEYENYLAKVLIKFL